MLAVHEHGYHPTPGAGLNGLQCRVLETGHALLKFFCLFHDIADVLHGLKILLYY